MGGGYFTHVSSASTVSALRVVFTQQFPAGNREDLQTHNEMSFFSRRAQSKLSLYLFSSLLNKNSFQLLVFLTDGIPLFVQTIFIVS